MTAWLSKENIKLSLGSILLSLVSSVFYDLSKALAGNYEIIRWAIIFVVVGLYTYILARFLRETHKKEESAKFWLRTGYHHDFEHRARNLGVKLMPPKLRDEIFVTSSKVVSLSGNVHKEYREELSQILDALVQMFETLVPEGTKVWACIRERRSDDHYHTMLRAGTYNSTRDQHSQPIHKNSKTILNLKDSYRIKKDCVIITGSGEIGKLNGREPVSNDSFREDLSVLMGAVMSKSWNGDDFDTKKLNWILCVNADREGVFNESHIPLMKSCNDTFSWLLNMFIRKSYELQILSK